MQPPAALRTQVLRPRLRLTPVLGVLAMLLPALLMPAAGARAGGCYPDGYYSFLFLPTVQKAAGGDVRLVGASDSLTATGEDPKDKPMGSGCMCGVNNGRWDQILINRAERDRRRAPVSFRIDSLAGRMFDKRSQRRGRELVIGAGRLAACFGAALKSRGFRGYDHPSGLSRSPAVLEPGENMVGCLCLPQKLRAVSGVLKLQVSYTPVILVRPLVTAASPAGGCCSGRAVIRDLARGRARYFRLDLPRAGRTSELRVSLQGRQKARLYILDRARGFKYALTDWHHGGLRLPAPRAGAVYWIMVRAAADGAGGELRVSYRASAAPGPAGSPVPVIEPVSPPARRVFTVHLLGMGSAEKKTKGAFDPGTSKARPCCSGGG